MFAVQGEGVLISKLSMLRVNRLQELIEGGSGENSFYQCSNKGEAKTVLLFVFCLC